MANINTVVLVGNLTRDVEITQTQSGLEIGKFSLAINGRKKDDPNDVSYFDITVFDKLAGLCSKYIAKGSSVAISGNLKQDRFEDKDGNKRSKVNIIANNVQFLGSKSDKAAGQDSGGYKTPVYGSPNTITDQANNPPIGGDVDMDDVPF